MIYIWLILQLLYADTKANLETGIRAESNAMYNDRDLKADVAAYISPNLYLANSGKAGRLFLALDSVYNKYASNANLDNIEYNVLSGFDWNLSKKVSVSLVGGYEFLSEPPQIESGETLDKSIASAKASIEYKQSDLSLHKLNFMYKTTSYSETDLDYAVNNTMSAEYLHYYNFLPETAFIVQAYGDMSIYPEGRKLVSQIPGTTRFLNDNIGYKLAAGFEGRLTEYSLFRFLFGYYVRSFEFDTNFSEPVFEVSFQEQITPQDTLIAGYNYKVIDSTYTNYELNQQMYLGYSRVFSDRFILLFRSNYMYKSYSLPNRREDQKMYGTVQVDFSYRPNWIIKAGFSGDILLSDTIDTRDTVNIDPAISYQAFQLYVASKVVF